VIVWIEFGPVVSMRVAVDALSLCLPCPSVGRPAKSESIKVSLNQDNKSKEEETRLLGTKDNRYAPRRHLQDSCRA
jgi:hypothetical protein